MFKKTYRWKDFVEIMAHDYYLFNKRVVGVMLSERFWREGFCYQEIRVWGKTWRFLFTEYKYFPFFFTPSKVEKYLKELFSFVPEGIIIKDVSEVEVFNRKIPARFLSHPLSGYFENDEEEGVFFKTKNGKEFHFLKEKGKAVQKP
ncbi:MAG: hypothetical protein DSY42_03030, partial [Aquifex sp.]